MHNRPRSSRFRLPRSGVPVEVAPSLQPRYRTFLTTTSHSAPVRRIGTQSLTVLPLASLPCHRHDRFPRSTQEPGSRSRRLHAGRRPSSRQVPLGLVPESYTNSGFDVTRICFDTSTAVHLRSTPRPSPDRVSPCLFPTRSPPRLLSAAAVGGLKPPPARRLRGTFPHLLRSMAAGEPALSSAPSWHTSGSPGESHPQAPSEPYVHVSAHTAHLDQSVASRRGDSQGCTTDQGPPDSGCPGRACRSRWPLRSSPVTGPSSLLQATPPLCAASVLSRSRFCRLRVSLAIGTTGSHVPRKSPDRVLAASMPDAARAVGRCPSDSSRSPTPTPVLTSPEYVSTPLQRFTCVRLHDPHLTGSRPAFSQLAHHRAS